MVNNFAVAIWVWNMKLLIPLIVGLLGTPLVNGNSRFKKRVFARDQKYQDTPEASVLSFAKGMYPTLIKIALGYLCLVINNGVKKM